MLGTLYDKTLVPLPRMVFHTLNIFDINFSYVNLNGWKTLLCLVVIAGEHGMDLTSYEIICMYCLKRNDSEKGRVYISCVVGHELHLKLPYSTSGWNDKYFYITRDIWGDGVDLLVCYTWNHHFRTPNSM